MPRPWRRWMPSPKYGVARGVGVLGYPSPPDPTALADLLGRSERLSLWAREHAVDLRGEPLDLRRLDAAIAEQDVPPEVMAWLPLDAGLYLGRLLVEHVTGARWTVWPNGHPVVHLPKRGDIDVTAVAEPGGLPLWQTYQRLAS